VDNGRFRQTHRRGPYWEDDKGSVYIQPACDVFCTSAAKNTRNGTHN
jgi:hypothetical protein